ncbi:MAG: hypothetical protein CAF44_013310 [Nitrospira sp. CG24D]|nr:MAG: hypothetical protein CAF44_013310 [Nitrospira sp. CG24D]
MDCPKCKGLMMLERFSDFFLAFYAWKCVNCGAVIDRTIAKNRRNSLAGPRPRRRQPDHHRRRAVALQSFIFKATRASCKRGPGARPFLIFPFLLPVDSSLART